MRTFIAIDLPRSWVPLCQKLQQEFLPFGAFTLVKTHFHCTLKFLGDLDQATIEEVKAKLSKVTFLPFAISTASLGVFPSESHARVLWLGFDGKVVQFHQAIEDSLLPQFPRDPAFKAHATLARIKSLHNTQAFREKLHSIKIPVQKGHITSFTLYKSTLTPQGPVYEVLKDYPLR